MLHATIAKPVPSTPVGKAVPATHCVRCKQNQGLRLELLLQAQVCGLGGV